MSKEMKNVEATATEYVAEHVLDVIKTAAGGVEPTLKAFALAMDIPATRIYAIAKRPVVGAVYDPNAKNWDALSDYMNGKVQEGKFESMTALVNAAVEKDKWLAENAHVRTASGNNTIEVDGGKMPKRKAAMFEMGSEQESLIAFKHDAAVYKIVYQTLGYTVIRPVNEDGSFAKEEIRVISNGTLNTKCVAPTEMAKAVADRFSGAYAEQTKTEVEATEAAPVEGEADAQ